MQEILQQENPDYLSGAGGVWQHGFFPRHLKICSQWGNQPTKSSGNP
jgi:hypothetical protein